MYNISSGNVDLPIFDVIKKDFFFLTSKFLKPRGVDRRGKRINGGETSTVEKEKKETKIGEDKEEREGKR